MIVLGIETSCDETAAAVIDGRRQRLSDLVLSQTELHTPYGGIVPEIAARAHLDHIDRLIAQALAEARIGLDRIDAVAATCGPGLIGGVLVGAMTGKAIALARNLPFLAINHLEGHALSARLSDDVAFPYLLLLVSGGHCQLLAVEGVGRYARLGTTIDDAVGEAFDKTAKLLGLGYPGGPAIERAAAAGDPARYDFPRPLRGRPGCDFSFAGLKTAVRQTVEALPAPPDPGTVADIAASFQMAVADALANRTANAIALFRARYPAGRTLVVAGGVAANTMLRQRLTALAVQSAMTLVAPPPRLCTDNAAMIAWAGIERLKLGLIDGLDFAPRPRWPLDPAATQGSRAKA
ncbi:MAG: tRNA (adenosine(37)-N6)-threonylcarbamoyltransferase complex transferase subunit TsaD [Rhodospirillales bacterium]|nr:tRNA (adenosine(37)-N6)-threonylcarbamoyltransferase complex transferase subunit TsaD [Rhodospirillales bacterium]